MKVSVLREHSCPALKPTHKQNDHVDKLVPARNEA